jgi:hypothetical protein
MIVGLLIVKATWLKRIDPSIRQRLEILKFPVKILFFGFEEGWFGIGGIKNPMLTLYFANDNYGQTFVSFAHQSLYPRVSAFLVHSSNCSLYSSSLLFSPSRLFFRYYGFC